MSELKQDVKVAGEVTKQSRLTVEKALKRTVISKGNPNILK